jgi:hypothetical protein
MQRNAVTSYLPLEGKRMTHLPLEEADLPATALDMHRAIGAAVAALQALDLNSQRFEACTDPELRRVLAHAGDTSRKEVAMLLEWMRRRDARLDKEMKEALFKAGPIVAQYHYDEKIL